MIIQCFGQNIFASYSLHFVWPGLLLDFMMNAMQFNCTLAWSYLLCQKYFLNLLKVYISC